MRTRKNPSKSDRVKIFSPAKVNLMLSIHGMRKDGFHELTSLVVPLGFGDTLSVTPSESCDKFVCLNQSALNLNNNLILQAAECFRGRLKKETYFYFELDKCIPIGAGLGGGSSNAAVALKAMNQLCDEPFGDQVIKEMAATLGSDCPFFIEQKPSIIRGRGEIVEALDEACANRLRGMQVVLFCPNFKISTTWAYKRIASKAPQSYEKQSRAEQRIKDFSDGAPISELLYNSFEAVIGEKFILIPTLIDNLTQSKRIDCMMSGSGSCCFAVFENKTDRKTILRKEIENALGNDVFWVETYIN